MSRAGYRPAVPLAPARRLWQLCETIHAVTYFAPESRVAYDALGLKGFWMGYFAGRTAAMGPVPPEVVTAVCFNFHPRMVSRAIPDAWSLAPPSDVVVARTGAAVAALRRLFADAADGPAVVEAAEMLRSVVADLDPAGRPLFGAHASLSWPGEPLAVLWQAATLVREHRGDGHVAALLANQLDGCEAHVTLVATGALSEETLRPNRGWSEEEWAAARRRLHDRRLVDEGGQLTADGVALRSSVEDLTDALASGPADALGSEGMARISELLEPMVGAVVDGGGVPFPNPMGLPGPGR